MCPDTEKRRTLLILLDTCAVLFADLPPLSCNKKKVSLHNHCESGEPHDPRFAYLLAGGADLGLLGAPDLLHPVLALLLLLRRRLRPPLDHALPRQPELGLELLGKVHRVVDEGEAGALAATEVGLEAVGEDAVRSCLLGVRLGQNKFLRQSLRNLNRCHQF